MTGNYIRTCLGNYIDYLVRQPAPIRDNEEPLPADSPHVLSIPKELWLLVDAISKHPNKVSAVPITDNTFLFTT